MRCGFLKSQMEGIEAEISSLDKQIAALPEVKVWDVNAAKIKLKETEQKEKEFTEENKESFVFLKEKRELLKQTFRYL